VASLLNGGQYWIVKIARGAFLSLSLRLQDRLAGLRRPKRLCRFVEPTGSLQLATLNKKAT